MTQRVAVVGGAGYVGTEVCRELKRRGHVVIAIAHPSGRLLLERFGIRVADGPNAASVAPVDVVINLAYPSLADTELVPKQNRDLLKLVNALAAPGTRLIHVSTLAVFGFALEYAAKPGPLRRRRDFAYVEAKIDFEVMLQRTWRSRAVDVLRLGNVWGPGSPTWTAALADRLLFGEPVGIRGVDGYCNVTDVANVAAYVGYLVENPPAGWRYSHLAELGGLRWSFWIDRLGAFLGVAPEVVQRRGWYPGSMSIEVRSILAEHSPFALSRQLRAGRFTGSLRRSAPARLIQGVVRSYTHRRGARQEPWFPADPPIDPIFLEVMGAMRRFESCVVEGWKPPVDQEASWRATEDWLRVAGYP